LAAFVEAGGGADDLLERVGAGKKGSGIEAAGDGAGAALTTSRGGGRVLGFEAGMTVVVSPESASNAVSE
jgi:hypothetical protein